MIRRAIGKPRFIRRRNARIMARNSKLAEGHGSARRKLILRKAFFTFSSSCFAFAVENGSVSERINVALETRGYVRASRARLLKV